MKSITINGSKRESVGKVATKALRNAGKVPCVLYGGEQAIHFSADELAFRNLVYTPNVYTASIELESGEKFDAICGACDLIAIGAMRALQEHNIVIPKQVSVVGFDDISFAGIYSPPLTTIRQDRREIGRRATLMLLGLINGTQDGEDRVIVGHTLVQRSSTIELGGGLKNDRS